MRHPVEKVSARVGQSSAGGGRSGALLRAGIFETKRQRKDGGSSWRICEYGYEAARDSARDWAGV
jgi:hypothetical protein